MELSQTEENYLKTLFHLTIESFEKTEAGTNELAHHLNISPASVNDMLKKLKKKELVDYKKYGKITLTGLGQNIAVQIIRKHRLWETFLYEKLNFTWDEVHEVAEQLEHINSEKLITQLEKFLNFPKFDPHGDAIPNSAGEVNIIKHKNLSEIAVHQKCKAVAVKDNGAKFLQYVLQIGLTLSSEITILNRLEFDGSMEIEVNGEKKVISKKLAENIFVV